jgi:hypothetical protein
MDWPAKSGAALAVQAWRNPFLDRPVSADGQEKVAMHVVAKAGLSPFRDGWPPLGRFQNYCGD